MRALAIAIALALAGCGGTQILPPGGGLVGAPSASHRIADQEPTCCPVSEAAILNERLDRIERHLRALEHGQ